MQNLQRRPSGIYVLRLVVPHALRAAFGRREVIVSTGTRELAVAKLVASSHAAKWRAHFFQAAALLLPCSPDQMNDAEILRLAEGSPLLQLGGLLPIAQVTALTGLPEFALLRAVRDGQLNLFIELPAVQGFSINPDDLELVDPELGVAGGYVIPSSEQMPRNAVRMQYQGKAFVDALDLPGVCEAVEQEAPITLVCLRIAGGSQALFIPDEPYKLHTKNLTLDALQVEAVRRRIAVNIDPDRLKTARAVDFRAILTPVFHPILTPPVGV